MFLLVSIMFRKIFLKVYLLVVFVVALSATPTPQIPPTILSDPITRFTVDLYKEANPDDDDSGNKIISPFSVLAALMLTMLGTGGNTKTELMTTLHLNEVNTTNIHIEYEKLQRFLNNTINDDVTLAIANRLFPKLGVVLSQKYEQTARDIYKSEVEALDFARNPEGSRKRINEWASDQTNNFIKEILPKGRVDLSSVMFLVNAIYFTGNWNIKFNKNETKKRDFYISHKAIKKVDMMKIDTDEHKSGVSQELKCKVLEIPYKGNKSSMLFILPNDIDGIETLEKQLSADTLNSLYPILQKQRTVISIPKFEMLTKFSLIESLEKLGIKDLFSSVRADFSEMFRDAVSGLYVSSVDHKAYIKVDEEGTEAAAVTAIGIRKSLPMTFTADHPFLFLIRENESGTILFIGRYNKP